MKEVITVNDLGCYPLWRCAAALGWRSSTPVEILCDLETSRIIIARSGQMAHLPEIPPR